MKLNKKIFLSYLILFGSMIIITIFFNEQNKEKNNNIENENKEIVYDKSAICYGNIGDMVVNVFGNDQEIKVIGRIVKRETVSAWIIDNIGDYTEESLKDEILEILYKQTDKLDYFNIDEIDRIEASTNIRDDQTASDHYVFDINYEYKANVSFDKYISSLENATNFNERGSCIINDGKEMIGTWRGIDNNFVYNHKYNVEVKLNSNNDGILTATEYETNEPFYEQRYIKYNLLEDNKLKIVYYTNKAINDIEYVDYITTKEFSIQNGNLSYFNFGEDILLEKQN